MGFADYLKNRQNQFESNKSGASAEGGKFEEDARLWRCATGKDGTGYAVVRFLPGLDVNKTSYSKAYKHAFKGPTGNWLIENCRTTLGDECPVCEYNKSLWETGLQENKDIVSKQSRKLEYFANVLVLKDPAAPQNEGKVMIMKFGKKIMEKLQAAQNPKFADDPSFDPFDMMDGANFRIKIQGTKNGPDYSASEFETPAPITKDMDKLEAVYNAQHDVHELVDPSKFKTYDDVKKRLNKVLGVGTTGGIASFKEEQSEPRQAPAQAKSSDADLRAAFQKRREEVQEDEAPSKPLREVAKAPAPADDDDDLESYFKSLAK